MVSNSRSASSSSPTLPVMITAHQVLSQRQRQRPERRRPVDHHRHQARHRHLHQHRGERLADGELYNARHHRRQYHLCRLVSHHRRLRGDQWLLYQRRHQRSADGLSSAAAGGNGVYAYGGSATTGLFPTNTYEFGELLGRCGLPPAARLLKNNSYSSGWAWTRSVRASRVGRLSGQRRIRRAGATSVIRFPLRISSKGVPQASIADPGRAV